MFFAITIHETPLPFTQRGTMCDAEWFQKGSNIILLVGLEV